jgi:PIN domain nuclease of toxin-antitoxin system
VDLDVDQERVALCAARRAQETVILLDTSAVLWLEQGHRRIRPLENGRTLYISPATLLELQLLVESGRLRARPRLTPAALTTDHRWLLDDVPAAKWFTTAIEIGWTRDPFDRLLVAHARVRGWKLATGDELLLEQLGARESIAL